MERELKIIYASCYNYTKQDTGEVKTGTQIQYLLNSPQDDTTKGSEAVSCVIRNEKGLATFRKLTQVPGVYKVKMAERSYQGRVQTYPDEILSFVK